MRVLRALLRPCARAAAQRPRTLATREATQRPSRALAARALTQRPGRRLAARALSYPAHEVVGLPALSPTMEVGTIQKWHVEEGGSFGEGDTICEIETDKATIDFTAQDEGVVARLLQPEGTDFKQQDRPDGKGDLPQYPSEARDPQFASNKMTPQMHGQGTTPGYTGHVPRVKTHSLGATTHSMPPPDPSKASKNDAYGGRNLPAYQI